MAKSTSERKITLAQVMFLIGGLLLLIKYLLENSLDTSDVFAFLTSLFVMVVLIGFYVMFVFGLPGFNSPWKSLAPSVLILAICGGYSLDFGNAEVTKYLSGVASMAFVLILVSLFVFVFLPKKWLGITGGVASLVYAAFVIVSYVVMAIIAATNSQAFSLSNLLQATLLAGGLILIFCGLFVGLKHRDWFR